MTRAGKTFLAVLLVAISMANAAFGSTGTLAYVPNSGPGNISVIDTSTNTVVATIPGSWTNPGGMVID